MTPTWDEKVAAAMARMLYDPPQEAKDARKAVITELCGPAGWEWLHGWPRFGMEAVLIGRMVHCIGCGKVINRMSCADPDGSGWPFYPGDKPDWPYTVTDCPVCRLEPL